MRRLRLDAVDLLLLHWPSREVPLAETMGALNRVRAAGKARHIGVSNFTTAMIEEGRCFGVNVLRAGQGALSNRFASKKDEWQRFEGVETFTAKTGAPLLAEALVNLDCRLVAVHEAGDHLLCVGEIEEARVREGEPLVYFRASYGRFQKDV